MVVAPRGGLAASPPVNTAILYLRQMRQNPDPPSLMEVVPADDGIAGATLGLQEINITGGFLAQHFTMDTVQVSNATDIAAALATHADHPVIVADLDARLLLELADMKATAGDVILDMATPTMCCGRSSVAATCSICCRTPRCAWMRWDSSWSPRTGVAGLCCTAPT
jgi:hypothetical protein